MFRVGDFAEAIFAERQRYDALLVEDGEDFLAHLALEHGVQAFRIGGQERQREQVELLDLRRPVDRRADCEVNNALTDRREFTRLIAANQTGARIQLDVDATVGLLLDEFCPAFGSFPPGEGRAENGGKTVFGFVVGSVCCREKQRQQGDGSGCDGDSFHETSRRNDCL